MIDRFSRWPEAVPMKEATVETTVEAFYGTWISRFGTPKYITTDQGKQFESYLFNALNDMIGATRIPTTAYHPEANGLVERWHRSLKAAIMCHAEDQWAGTLPTILLGLRTTYKEDINASCAEFLFGKTRSLPGEFFLDEDDTTDPKSFIQPLRTHLRRVRPVHTAHHTNRKPFMFRDLATCSHVFLRTDAMRRALQPPYTGHYRVVERINDRIYKINIDGRDDVVVSVDRLKPAYLAIQPDAEPPPRHDNTAPSSQTSTPSQSTPLQPSQPPAATARPLSPQPSTSTTLLSLSPQPTASSTILSSTRPPNSSPSKSILSCVSPKVKKHVSIVH